MSTEIVPHLHVGDQQDAEKALKNGFLDNGGAIVHACKEPYHRYALGYSGRGAPKEHPEYLTARRYYDDPANDEANRLILNMIDPDDPKYIPMELVREAVSFIRYRMMIGPVLVHCNQGRSRGPGVAMLAIKSRPFMRDDDFEAAETKFRALYPAFEPSKGVYGFLRENWSAF